VNKGRYIDSWCFGGVNSCASCVLAAAMSGVGKIQSENIISPIIIVENHMS
jgi:hypothetical protein